MRKRILVAAAVVAAGCGAGTTEPADSSAAQVVSVGDTVELRYGETAAIGQTGVRVQFREVVADSRCPIDAMCVWAGDAQVQIAVTQGAATVTYDLHTNGEPRAAQHGAYRLRLIEVGPSRRASETVPVQKYTVKLELSSS